MYGFLIQRSKFVQHATTSNEGNPKPRYLQKYVKRLDMEKHPFIHINHFLYCCPLISLWKYFGLKKQIYNTWKRPYTLGLVSPEQVHLFANKSKDILVQQWYICISLNAQNQRLQMDQRQKHPEIYSSTKIRKSQNEHLNIVCQNLNCQ